METVLVTGAGGYVGTTLVPELLQAGYRVRALDLYRHRTPGLLAVAGHPNLEIVKGDVRDECLVRNEVLKVDYIIHLAAVVGAPACDANPFEASHVNYGAVGDLTKWAYKHDKRVLFPNTNSGYGTTAPGTICTEDSPLVPVSTYGTTKRAAEEMVLSRGGVSFRFATAFGTSPRMRTDLLVNDFVLRAVRDRAVVLYEANARRNYVHVRDMARAFLHGMKNWDSMKGRAYNVGDIHHTKAELCAEIKEQIQEFNYVEAPCGSDPDKRDYQVSASRMAWTGFGYTVSLADGIRELRQAYKMFPGPEFTNL